MPTESLWRRSAAAVVDNGRLQAAADNAGLMAAGSSLHNLAASPDMVSFRVRICLPGNWVHLLGLPMKPVTALAPEEPMARHRSDSGALAMASMEPKFLKRVLAFDSPRPGIVRRVAST